MTKMDLQEIKQRPEAEIVHKMAMDAMHRPSWLDGATADHEIKRGNALMMVLQDRRQLIEEAERQAALLAKIESRLDFLMGFIDDSDPKAISLSSEHSVGEQIEKLRKLVRQEKGE